MGSLKRKHLDLFSGIGGFALAARWAGIETIGFCEIDKYAQKVLQKNFPGVPIYEDVTKLNGSEFKDIYLLTGGFPCQDISIAGKGAGIEGERSGLWSELFRIIGEVRPRYALIENVPALTFRGGTRVIGDLAEIGYDTEWQIVGADDVGAPHRRKRIWIVAYANCESESNGSQHEQWMETGFVPYTNDTRLWSCQRRTISKSLQENDARGDNQRGNGNNVESKVRKSSVIQKDEEDVAYSKCMGWEQGGTIKRTGRVRETPDHSSHSSEDVADSNSKREIGNKSEYREGCGFESRSENVADSNSKRQQGQGKFESTFNSTKTGKRETTQFIDGGRQEFWLTEPDVGRVAHGIPNRMDRLKGLGNAIVPQVAYEIIRCLK